MNMHYNFFKFIWAISKLDWKHIIYTYVRASEKDANTYEVKR